MGNIVLFLNFKFIKKLSLNTIKQFLTILTISINESNNLLFKYLFNANTYKEWMDCK